jgi:uncharacterized protein with FMN-binding domain
VVTAVRRIVLWVMGTATALVLLFGYHTSTSSTAAASGGGSVVIGPAVSGRGSSGSSGPTGSTGSTGSSGSTGSTGSSGSSGSTGSGSSTAKTVTGDVAQTRWGPVQVQISVAGGRITDVSVVQYPNNNPRDQEINAYALPILVQETTSAQSAKIDMVSGATVTSEGYLQSLQSALDQAGM